jgi:predicted transcriptional regulator
MKIWRLVSFIGRSKQRRKILELVQTPATPMRIARKLDAHLTHISRTLREFRNHGLVECLTPEEKMERYYRITKLGKKVLSQMKKIEKNLSSD